MIFFWHLEEGAAFQFIISLHFGVVDVFIRVIEIELATMLRQPFPALRFNAGLKRGYGLEVVNEYDVKL